MRMVGASVQHARILDQLGENRQASDAIEQGISLLEDSSVSVQIPADEKMIWLARLANEKGNYINRGFRSEEAVASFRNALSIAEKLPVSNEDAQIEMVRAYIGLGTSRSRGRRGSTNVKPRKEERRQALEKAVATLDRLRSQQSGEVGNDVPTVRSAIAATEILRARSYLGLAALGQGGGRKRTEQADKAVLSLIHI